jgi:hypothetical protein
MWGKQCGEHASIVPRPAFAVVAPRPAFAPTAPDAVRPAAYDTRRTQGVPPSIRLGQTTPDWKAKTTSWARSEAPSLTYSSRVILWWTLRCTAA